jgi:hypothetical protein
MRLMNETARLFDQSDNVARQSFHGWYDPSGDIRPSPLPLIELRA